MLTFILSTLIALSVLAIIFGITVAVFKNGGLGRAAVPTAPPRGATTPPPAGAAPAAPAAAAATPAPARTVAAAPSKTFGVWLREKLDKIFSGGTIWVIAALLFLEYALYKYVPAAQPMFTGYGLFHIPVYIVAIIILAGLENAKGKQKTFGVAAMVIALTIIGLSHTTLSWPSGWFSGKSAVVLNGGLCTEKVRLATIRNDGSVINPNGECFIRVHEETAGECLNLYDRFDRYLGNDCTGTTNFDGKYAARVTPASRGVTDGVSIIYVLCNSRGRTNLVSDGCP